jgi:hypothetical protein
MEKEQQSKSGGKCASKRKMERFVAKNDKK